MIEQQAYTATYRAQGEERTAGYMPVVGEKKNAEAQSFYSMVAKSSDASGASSTDDTADSDAAKPAQHGGFFNFLMTLFDIINPLEHIPVISTIYEKVTGHHMNAVARVAGDTLYGGPIGAAVGVANVVAEKSTGKDIGENVVAMLSPSKGKAASDVQVARNTMKTPTDIVWNDAASPAQAGDENVQVAMLTRSPVSRTDFSSAAISAPKTDTDTNSPFAPGPAPTKLSYRTGPNGKNPALLSSSYKDKGLAQLGTRGPAANAVVRTTRSQVNVNPADPSQKAPAGMTENRVISPELIAQKMMTGLDKYAALKQTQDAYATAF